MQHLALLDLTANGGFDRDEVFEWAVNVPALQQRLLDALDRGEADLLPALRSTRTRPPCKTAKGLSPTEACST